MFHSPVLEVRDDMPPVVIARVLRALESLRVLSPSLPLEQEETFDSAHVVRCIVVVAQPPFRKILFARLSPAILSLPAPLSVAGKTVVTPGSAGGAFLHLAFARPLRRVEKLKPHPACPDSEIQISSTLRQCDSRLAYHSAPGDSLHRGDAPP